FRGLGDSLLASHARGEFRPYLVRSIYRTSERRRFQARQLAAEYSARARLSVAVDSPPAVGRWREAGNAARHATVARSGLGLCHSFPLREPSAGSAPTLFHAGASPGLLAHGND